MQAEVERVQDDALAVKLPFLAPLLAPGRTREQGEAIVHVPLADLGL